MQRSKKSRRLESFIAGAFAWVFFYPCMGSELVGVLTLLWQCGNWFKFGQWPPLTLRDGLANLPKLFGASWDYYIPNTGYLGLDQVLSWVLDSPPLALWLIVIAPWVWGVFGFLIFSYSLGLVRDRNRLRRG